MREPWSFLAKEESASGSGSGSESESGSEGRGVRPRGVRGRHVRQDLHLAIAVDSNARVRGAPGERAKREARVRESEGGAHVGRDQCVQIDTDHCGRTRRASERMGANERANERTSERANEQTSERANEQTSERASPSSGQRASARRSSTYQDRRHRPQRARSGRRTGRARLWRWRWRWR